MNGPDYEINRQTLQLSDGAKLMMQCRWGLVPG